MARQLYEQDATPAAIVMFDVDLPGSGTIFSTRAKLARFWRNVRAGGANYLRKKFSEKREYYWTLFMEKAVLPAGVHLYKLARRPLSAPLRFYWVSQGHWRAYERYSFKPFPGKITQVRATDRGPEVLGREEDPTLGWGALAQGGVDVIDVPTQHMHMLFDPYVTTFAKTLTKILSR
jgi:thioesterase domain-containing protein